MEFRIADTFTTSLARLTNQEQKAVKTTSFDLQMDPSGPGLSYHKLDRAADPSFASVRVSRDIRLIVHRTKASLMLCYVDHHDRAYAWAERRKIVTHPRTGAAQLVEVRERIEEVPVHVPVEVPAPAPAEPRLFADVPDDDLLRYGVPEDWLPEVLSATESDLFDLADQLPQEAAEALLELATGGTPEVAPLPAVADPFRHPDALRRFRVMENAEELALALEYPWERWTIFLHPTQRQYVERDYNGPARVAGTAGTGKTVVALHRAAWLARNHPDARVLLTTFSPSLAANLSVKLDRLVSEPSVRQRIDVETLTDAVLRMHEEIIGPPKLVSDERLSGIVAVAGTEEGTSLTPGFVEAEWREVVDAWNLKTWGSYRDVPRLGRKTRLGLKQRETLWAVFDRVRDQLTAQGLMTVPMVLDAIAMAMPAGRPRYDYAIVDEAQDLGVAQLRFLAALGAGRDDALFFSGDLGQRIFQTPFSWRSLGVDVRGRSFILRVNYRTSHQIRRQADRLLPRSLADVDGVAEDRRGVLSVFDGAPPKIQTCDSVEDEANQVSAWITRLITQGVAPGEIGIFVRSKPELARAIQAASSTQRKWAQIDSSVGDHGDAISVGTMHLAKGLEFRAVAVMACDDVVVPNQERVESVTDEADLEEVYNTERHLLYVACTRARDHLMVSGVRPASEFLDDLLELRRSKMPSRTFSQPRGASTEPGIPKRNSPPWYQCGAGKTESLGRFRLIHCYYW